MNSLRYAYQALIVFAMFVVILGCAGSTAIDLHGLIDVSDSLSVSDGLPVGDGLVAGDRAPNAMGDGLPVDDKFPLTEGPSISQASPKTWYQVPEGFDLTEEAPAQSEPRGEVAEEINEDAQ